MTEEEEEEEDEKEEEAALCAFKTEDGTSVSGSSCKKQNKKESRKYKGKKRDFISTILWLN